MIFDTFPTGPQSFGEHAVSGQNIDTVTVPTAEAMCIGPVLEDTRRLT